MPCRFSRLLNVGLVTAALLASTSMVMAQSTNTYRYHRHHHTTRNADVPYGYQGSLAGTEGIRYSWSRPQRGNAACRQDGHEPDARRHNRNKPLRQRLLIESREWSVT